MNRKLMLFGGGLVALAVIARGGTFAWHHRVITASTGSSQPTDADSTPIGPHAGNVVAALATLQIAMPGNQYQLGKAMTCSTPANQAYALRCEEDFVDYSNAQVTDYVVIYVLHQMSDIASLLSTINGNLSRLQGGTLISTDGVYAISSDKNGNPILSSEVGCQQAVNNTIRTYAVCSAMYGETTMVTSAVYPQTISPSVTAASSPEIQTAQAFEELALVTLNRAITPGAN